MRETADWAEVLQAGLHALFNPRIWLRLLGAAFSLASLARAIGATLLVLAGAWVMMMLPAFLKWLPGFVIAAWLTPVIMRRASAIIATRVVATRPGATRMAARPLPPTGTYRAWWLPLVLCDAALPPLLDAFDLPARDALLFVALLLVAAAAPGAIVRSVLAPWFAIPDIDRALAARRGFWAAVAIGYIFALASLQQGAARAAELGGLGSLVGVMFSGGLGDGVSTLLLDYALSVGAFVVAFVAGGIFCTGALTWLAAKALGGDEACAPRKPDAPARPRQARARPESAADAPPTEPTALPDEPTPPPRPRPSPEAVAAAQRDWADVLVARPTPERPAPPPPPRARPPAPSPAQVKAAQVLRKRQTVMVVVFALTALVLAHDFVAPLFLGAEFRDAVDRHGDWMDLGVRAQARTDMACQGRTRTLRVLSWLDVGATPSRQNAALGCAALHGHLETVQALVALGEDIDRPSMADVMPGDDPGPPRTPLQQAVRTPAGLPVAEWLLAHGAKPQGALESATAARCQPCLEWLKLHDPLER